MKLPLDRRPVLVALAGPNGSGKSTFYGAHLRPAALRLVNADVIAAELGIDPYAAARAAEVMRRKLVEQRESFVFETVFSDPAGDKLGFLRDAAEAGYNVIVCFIGISSAKVSEERVAMRVSQGGHDVPADKIVARFPRTLGNLRAAIDQLPCVMIFDNDDLRRPYRQVAIFKDGRLIRAKKPLPTWLSRLLRRKR
jgi:predicted ABC-type ATPase